MVYFDSCAEDKMSYRVRHSLKHATFMTLITKPFMYTLVAGDINFKFGTDVVNF